MTVRTRKLKTAKARKSNEKSKIGGHRKGKEREDHGRSALGRMAKSRIA